MRIYEGWAPNFIPSNDTKKALLLLRKENSIIGGKTKPGIYSFSGITTDLLLTALVLVLELIGMSLIKDIFLSMIDPGSDESEKMLALAYGIPIAAFFIDITVSIFHNKWSNGRIDILNLENIKLSQDGTVNANNLKEKNINEINGLKRLALFSTAIAYGLAIIKVVGVWLLGQNDMQNESTGSDSNIAILVCLYFLTAYLNITRTGYCIAALGAKIRIEWNKRSFINNPEIPNNPLRATWQQSNFIFPGNIKFSNLQVLSTTPDPNIDLTNLYFHKSDGNGIRLMVKGLLTDKMIFDNYNQIQDPETQKLYLSTIIEMQQQQVTPLK